MITPIDITPEIVLPLNYQDISVFHIQMAFNNNTIPTKSLNRLAGVFYALKFIEYTDHKKHIMTTVLTSCRMALLNKLQYKFI